MEVFDQQNNYIDIFLCSVALAEWLRRVPAKYMGFPLESSNLSGDVSFLANRKEHIFIYILCFLYVFLIL